MLSPFPCPGVLYPLRIPHRTRTPGRPMQILALGLSRTGTDSLRSALEQLGYDKVYHGFTVVEQEVWTDARAWFNLLDRKNKKSDKAINRETFDNVLGDYVAVSDLPAVLFATELLNAYPDAKVILNKRSNVKDWKESFRKTLLAGEQSLTMRILSYFNIELFWLQRNFELVIFALFRGRFESNAEEVYTRHYTEIEGKLQEDRRPYLEWRVQDGWGPLCAFLEKDVPDIEFPSGNAKQAFDERTEKLVGRRVLAAMQMVAILVLGLLGIASALWWGILQKIALRF